MFNGVALLSIISLSVCAPPSVTSSSSSVVVTSLTSSAPTITSSTTSAPATIALTSISVTVTRSSASASQSTPGNGGGTFVYSPGSTSDAMDSYKGFVLFLMGLFSLAVL